MPDANLAAALIRFRVVVPILGACLLLTPMTVPADDTFDTSLKSASEALARDALEEAEQLNGQVINASEATRIQRASAFAGRCATRYKQGLATRNPALIPQAIGDCDRALELKSDLHPAYRIRGVALLSAGHPDRAAEDLAVAVALNPEDHLSFQNRALALAKLGRSKEAMAELDAAIRLKPDHPWSYYNRGRLRIAQGDYETSIDDFIAFIRFKRDHEEVYRLRGMSRLLIGMPQQAVGDFYESLRLRPNHNPEALLARGMAFFLLERFAEAEQDLAQALPLQSGHVETRLWLFLTRQRLGKVDRELLNDPSVPKDPKNWPEILIPVFLGTVAADKALEAARAGEDPVASRLKGNLTLLLLAHKARGEGHEAEATRWLETLVASQEREAPYYQLARQALRRTPTPMADAEDKPTPPAPLSQRSKTEADDKLATASTPKTPATRSKTEADDKHATASTPKTPATRSKTEADDKLATVTPRHTEERPSAPSGPPQSVHAFTVPPVERMSAPGSNPDPHQSTRPIHKTPASAPATKPAAETAPPTGQTAGTPATEQSASKTAAKGSAPPTGSGATNTPKTKPALAATPDSATATSPEGKKARLVFKAASFGNASYANNALNQYLQLGLPAFLEQTHTRDKILHRVLIGPFDEQGRAEEARDLIRKLPNHTPGEITKR
ncbi:MAG: tetratricopeptide repeat protein [Magnetococcales bacterium]|nr:tetratricopeptide repeat protein [Magnetococcales bacterium]